MVTFKIKRAILKVKPLRAALQMQFWLPALPT